MMTKVSLLEIESGLVAKSLGGITTMTFFKGNITDNIQTIKNRFKKIILLNPWLTGKLIKSRKDKRIQLVYDDHPTGGKTMDLLFFLNPTGIALDSRMTYSEMVESARSSVVLSAQTMLNKDVLVSKLILTRDTNDPDQSFALIFSISHVIADGHTYYTILNMLSGTTEVKPLNVTRKDASSPEMMAAVGKREYAYFHGVSHIINALKGNLFSKNTRSFAYYIDVEEVAAIKASSALKSKTEYISTNDILTSSFSNLIESRLTSMAINFRGRLSALRDNDAGNYEGVVLYDRGGYRTPETIRKTLQNGASFLGLTGNCPKLLEGIFCQMGLITNWTAISKEIQLEDAEETLHLPLIISMPYEAAIIFRAKKKETGMIFFTRKLEKRHLEASNLPLKNIVSQEIFP